MLVRGEVQIVNSDGTALPRRRRTIALCRCGSSGLMPLCDGTHKLVGKAGRHRAGQQARPIVDED
jgi:CDGSH-type Zn-finger protein